MTVVKTRLQKWPQMPWPEAPKYRPLTLTERVAMLEDTMWGATEPSGRRLKWLEERAAAEVAPAQVALPLCERRRL